MPILRRKHSAKTAPGFKLYDPTPLLNNLRQSNMLDPAKTQEIAGQIRELHNEVAGLWGGWLKRQKENGISSEELASEHLELSKEFAKLGERLVALENGLDAYKAGAFKGRLLGMTRSLEHLYREVGLKLVFISEEAVAKAGDKAATVEEAKAWASLMSMHDRASLIALEALTVQTGDTVLKRAGGVIQEAIRFEVFRRAFKSGTKAVKLDADFISAKAKQFPAGAGREEITGMANELRACVRESKKEVSARKGGVVLSLERVDAHRDVIARGKGMDHRFISFFTLAFAGGETLLDALNVVRIKELELAGNIGLIIGLTVLGFDLANEGSSVRKAMSDSEVNERIQQRIKKEQKKIIGKALGARLMKVSAEKMAHLVTRRPPPPPG